MTSARILIVEDEILVAREIQSHLQEIGYAAVGFAIDGEMALQRVAETLPDLVLMDINLPGSRDGIAIAAEIRDRFQIPVIYLTAYADNETIERAKPTNPFGYIIKPFTKQDLRVAIELGVFRSRSGIEEQMSERSKHSGGLSNPVSDSITSEAIHPDSINPLGGLIPSKLRKILDYIETHLNQGLSLERLANEVGMTSYYFAKLFKQSTGKSVHQYVIYRRVERAKRLLKQSDLSIADIAAECGFANPSHLALHFKRLIGVSPKKFRFF
jgi:YesN/AraC family two-component response regulator